MSSNRIVEHIKAEIESLEALRKNVSATSIFIQCPYHDDRTPSGGINLDQTKTVPLGWFSCFGCKKSVPWNTLAKTLGLKQLKGKGKRTARADDYLDPKHLRSDFLSQEDEEDDDTKKQKDLADLDFFDFPPEVQTWRGFKVELLKKVGAKYAYHDKSGEFIVWFPCVVKEKQVGYVKAFFDKVEGRPSYINSPGKWSRTHGLLFFDTAIEMMKVQGHKTIVLVEGPRDALRCLKYSIPAVCILGTKSWSEDKKLILEQAGVENAIIFMDGDRPDNKGHIAGKEATKLLAKSLKGSMNFKHMNLWKYEKDWDPGNCPKRFLKKVKSSLTAFSAQVV